MSKNQHIISPVILQLTRTIAQTYSLFSQPLTMFGIIILLHSPSMDSHSSPITLSPKCFCPLGMSLIGNFLFLLTDGYLNHMLLLGWILQYWIALFWFHSYPFPIHISLILTQKRWNKKKKVVWPKLQ